MHDLIRAKLKLVNQYIIPFSGLKEGIHEFTFVFGNEFFEEHEVLEVYSGDLKAMVLLEKKANLLNLSVKIDGSVEIQCDKCLESFNFPIRYRGNLLVKFGNNPEQGTDEIWVLRPEEHTLNLEQYFFECIGLSLPIQRNHSEKPDGTTDCNPEMLRILKSYSSQQQAIAGPDPRWDKLKSFLNDINTN